MEVKINTALCYNFLRGTGLKVSKDAMEEFKKSLHSYGEKIAKDAAASATDRKKKTIATEDVIDSVNNYTSAELDY